MECVEYKFKKYYMEDYIDFLRDFWNDSEFEGNIYYEYERRSYGRTDRYCENNFSIFFENLTIKNFRNLVNNIL